MLAVRAVRADPDDPVSAASVDEVDEHEIADAAPAGWVRVRLAAAALNRHDLWSLAGVGLPASALPMILGCDGAGTTDDGREVVVHAVVASPDWPGEETEDPRRSLLSERHHGTLAGSVWVPSANLVPKPGTLSFTDAACLPTAWLTAYRMLTTRSGAAPGSTVLVQGAGGGVSTALVALGAAMGYRIWVTSRDRGRAERAQHLGADAVFDSGAKLPERVDAVMESVGAATWSHSLRSVRPGGSIVVCGATSGDAPPAQLSRVFFQQIRIVGSTMGNREELARLLTLCATTGLRPVIDSVLPLASAREGLARLASGEAFGKIVLTV